jgi:3-dehydroquinate dehydratase/shikimate dehydrogenase
MICISIGQESRRFALVDMMNAARQCDLLEIHLDRFLKALDLGELLAAKPKPVIVTCRRARDGGDWQGSEDERLALLRQCIVAQADYVEIELDAADQVRRFPPSKRVISYTNLEETPADIADIYADMQTKSPDIIKLVTKASTPEEAWPLVQILARSQVPTVVVGLGKPGIMLTVLGRKIGAPWAYAALERGMEVYPGQTTVHELETVYHYRAIDRHTRLIGVTGFSERETVTVAALNAALAHFNLPARCLPLSLGDPRLFRKLIEAAKLAGVVVDAEHHAAMLPLATQLKPEAEEAQAVDLLLHKDKHWRGYYTGAATTVAALEAALRAKHPADQPLHGRIVLIVGVTATARAVANEVKRHGGILIIASRDRAAAQHLAQAVQCRHVPFEALYTTIHDVLIVCDEEKEDYEGRATETGIRPGFLKASMTVLDLTAGWSRSALLREAEERGCNVVSPREVLLQQLAMQARRIIGKEVPREVLAGAMANLVAEGE